LKARLAHQSVAEDQDAGLWRGLVEGRPEAARELCERFGPRLLAFAAARFPEDSQLAEDVMVQSLANAARRIGQFNPGRATFGAWLYGIARRQIRDELRRQKRMKSVPAAAQSPIDEAVDLSDGQDVAASVAARVDAQRLVGDLASALSDIEFEVLTLNCIDKLSAREIGRVVGRSERAVHSLLHRARVKARERLARDEWRAH
jgi:RNA polymerase sigma-70 factor (ECF subfamily)